MFGEDAISIVPGPTQPVQCAPDQQSGDENLLAALAQVTNWKRDGNVIELRGATTLRFRLMTNYHWTLVARAIRNGMRIALSSSS